MNPADCDWRNVAQQEIGHLQAIIGRHEEHAFRIRGYLYAILGVLTTALFLETPILTRAGYAGMCGVAIVMFLCMELVHRCYAGRAITRAGAIEETLRSGANYDGPRIGGTMNMAWGDWGRQIRIELSYPTLPLHYVLLAVFVVTVLGVER